MTQREFHAYRGKDYFGVVIATNEQLSEMGLTAGSEPKVDPVESLAQARAVAAAPRADFCNGLADIGLLTDADAVAAAKGAWPSPMDAFLEYLDPRERRDAQIEWATRATVERMHWAVLAMTSLGIATEDQADTLCGVAVPGEKD